MGAIFGTALTALIVVPPILTTVKRPTAIEVFKPFFNRTHRTVMTLSIVVSILALIASLLSDNWWWFGISLIMHLNGPNTLFMMMPLNNRLMAKDIDTDSEQTKKDLMKWGSLHAVRTSMNGFVFALFIGLLVFYS